ncbi:MAG: hypothetical protein RL189_1755 [Pseudomonadota bacterium]
MTSEKTPRKLSWLFCKASALVGISLLSSSLTACGTNVGQAVENNQSDAETSSSAAELTRENSGIASVAVLGDSQSTGGYGRRLSELIRASSKQRLVYFGAASSARVGSWVSGGFNPIPAGAYFGCASGADGRSCVPSMQSAGRTESIASILRRPATADLFILNLGDNHFYDPTSVRNELPKLVGPILRSGAKCAFITPTEGTGRFADKRNLMANIKLALDDIKKASGSTCFLIDSYTVGKEVLRTSADLQLMRQSVSADPMGLHPQGSGARLWGERVFDALVGQKLLERL